MKVAIAIAITIAVYVAVAVGRMLRTSGERDEQRAEHTRRMIEEMRRRRE